MPSQTRTVRPTVGPPEADGVPALRRLPRDSQWIAVALARGGSLAEAARRTGFSGGPHGTKARRIASLPEVRAAVAATARALAVSDPSPGVTLAYLRCALAASDVPDPSIARIVAQADGLLDAPQGPPPLDPAAIAAAVRAALRDDDDPATTDSSGTDSSAAPATAAAPAPAPAPGNGAETAAPPRPPRHAPGTRRRPPTRR